MPETAFLARLDNVIWAIIAAIAVLVAGAATLGEFHIVWSTFAAAIFTCIAMTAAAGYYLRKRDDARIASALGGTAQMIAFTAVAAPLSYIAASINLPLYDRVFADIDQALGLDWKALLVWMNARPDMHLVFAAAYLSFTAQVIAIVLLLAFTNKLKELRVFMLALVFSALVCIAVSAVLPAEGVWGYYKLSPTDNLAIVPAARDIHLSTFFGLRDGSFRNLVGLGSAGIITFPSFHAALGTVFIAAMWPVPLLRWIGIALNSLMIAATPVDGGHYFADVIAGIAIAVVCVAAAASLVHRVTVRRVAPQPITSATLEAAD